MMCTSSHREFPVQRLMSGEVSAVFYITPFLGLISPWSNYSLLMCQQVLALLVDVWGFGTKQRAFLQRLLFQFLLQFHFILLSLLGSETQKEVHSLW